MASAFSHAAVPLAVFAGSGRIRRDWRLLLVCMACSALPDLDSIGFKLGVAYASPWGHRGFTHSFVFALALAGLLTVAHRRLRSTPGFVFGMVFLATISHALLDAMTTGGLGVAFFWPFSGERYFLPWRAIRVSPISPRQFFGGRGGIVLRSELLWVWLPAVVLALGLALARRLRTKVKA